MKRQHPDDPNLFWCPRCKLYKPSEDFYNISRGKHRISDNCKSCLSLIGKNKKISSKGEMTKCLICGENFRQIRKKRKSKYCSKKCANIGLIKRTVSSCLGCGKTIFIKPHQIGRKKYCSKECSHEFKIKQKGEKRICNICHKEKKIIEFSKCTDRKSGYSYRCRSCVNKNAKKRYDAGLSYQKKGRKIKTREEKERRKKEWTLEYYKNPDNLKRMREISKKNKRASTINLGDSYVKFAIRGHVGISFKDITAELIELKRMELILYRNLKDFKKWRAENELGGSNERPLLGQ